MNPFEPIDRDGSRYQPYTFDYQGKHYCRRTNLPSTMCDCYDYDSPLPDRFAGIPHPSSDGHAAAVDKFDRLINPYKYEDEETS